MSVYDLEMYGRMMVDPGRSAAYSEALRRSVRPGAVVLDIGTGTGAHAMLAASLGAAQVIGVEPDDIVQLARSFARKNGLGDRVDFVQGFSQDLQLERPADVIVSDLRGSLPMFGRHFPSVVDARMRLLAPGGVLLPTRDRLRSGLVAAPDRWDELVAPWGRDRDGLDFSDGRPLATSHWVGFGDHQPLQESLLSEPAQWGTLDYGTLSTSTYDGTAVLEATRPGTAHGLCLWFDAEVLPGVGYSNAPGTGSVYGQTFVPWPRPVELELGSRVTVEISTRLVGVGHLLQWRTTVQRSGDAVTETFAQSNFGSMPLPHRRLEQRRSTATPRATEEARVTRTVIEAFDGSTALADVAARLAAKFPHRFLTEEDALAEVGDLAERYGV